MVTPLSDHIVVITGASSGIGRATAIRLARSGASLVLASRRKEVLDRLVESCERQGGKGLAVRTDVKNEESVKFLAAKAIETFGRIDVWINNAGVTLFGRIEDAPMQAFRNVIETNFFGQVHGARAVLPHFRQQGHGTLINIASLAGKIAQPYTSAYVASKHAIVGLSESLRMELRDAPRIHVCTVLPASIDTPLFQHAANYTGRAVKPMNPVYSTKKVVEALVDLILRPRREVFIGGAGRLIDMMRTVAAPVAEKMIAGQVERNHFQNLSAPDSEGNLFWPMTEYESISGGWLTGNGNAKKKASGKIMLGVAALSIGAGLFLWSQRRTSSNRKTL